jgi:hypothetical protein
MTRQETIVSRVRFWTGVAVSMALAGTLHGCGPDPEVRPPVHMTHGTLTINDEPAAGAMLVFHPADKEGFDARQTRPRADVGPDGVFEVTTYQQGDGAPTGDYKVGILWFKDPDASTPWDKLQGRYANPESTGIQVTINEGVNLLDPIDITGARVVENPPKDPTDHDQVD